ncbi:Acetyl CoA synthetase subunit alpha [Entamoeba marina]
MSTSSPILDTITFSSGQYAHDHLPKVYESMDDPVRALFSPNSVAIIGATEKPGIGRVTTANILMEGYEKPIYLINPTRPTVLGYPCHKSLAELPEVPEFVVIVTPAKTVPALIDECVRLKVKIVVVISAGFKEIGEAGLALENQITASLAKGNFRTRVIGPNCFGVQVSQIKLNATFAAKMCLPGSISMVSQSGALMASILDWSCVNGIGFSNVISVGSMLDLSWHQMLSALSTDPQTKVIVIYMESIGNAREFVAAASLATQMKPVIVLKAGRTASAASAAASHTGSLTGSDEVTDVAFQRAGVLRVDTIREMFAMATTLSRCVLPKGPNLAILTHAGGPGVMAADALERNGGILAKLSEKTAKGIEKVAPPHSSTHNPVDITGGATPGQFQNSLEVLKEDQGIDGVLEFVGPLTVCPSTAVIQDIRGVSKQMCVIPCLSGGSEIEGGKALTRQLKMPLFEFSDEAAKAYAQMWVIQDNIRKNHEAMSQSYGVPVTDINEITKKVNDVLNTATNEDKEILTEAESKDILSLYGLPVARTVIASTPTEAVTAANEMGYPVVVKIHSETITHKSDVGGVILDVASAQEVEKAYETIKERIRVLHPNDLNEHFLGVTIQPMIKGGIELILGASADPQYGPVLLYGSGGCYVNYYKDTACALPPLTENATKKLMEQVKVTEILKGVRGNKPVDQNKLMDIIIRFSQLISNHPRIKELDINPIVASSERIIALDARVVLWKKDKETKDIMESVIPLYPEQTIEIKDNTVIRAHKPDDLTRIAEFIKSVDENSRYAFFGKSININDAVSHAMMTRMLLSNYRNGFVMLYEDNNTIKSIIRVVIGFDNNADIQILASNISCQCVKVLINKTLNVLKSMGITLVSWGIVLDEQHQQYSNQLIDIVVGCGFKQSEKQGDVQFYQIKY